MKAYKSIVAKIQQLPTVLAIYVAIYGSSCNHVPQFPSHFHRRLASS